MDKEWFAVYTKSHFEKKVNNILTKKKIITFLPLRKGKAKIGGYYRFAEVPLFRSYLFVNISPNSMEYYKVLDTTGVSYIIKNRNRPCPISSEVIESLRKLVNEMNDKIKVIAGIKRGEKVKIVKGPLKGAQGEMLKLDNRRFKFVVNVDLLGRYVEVSIPPEYVDRV